ncbi:MAG: S46 family peptidase [Holophagaceae bacterium]
MSRTSRIVLPALAALLACGSLRADEGMWTFDNLPAKKMQAKYGFAPDQAWLDHVRLASLRFPGGSGSFVSRDGLVLTNHHVGRSWIQSVSGPGEKDYVKRGFVAKTREEEIKVPGLELNTLMQMDNVTDRVAKATASAKDEKAKAKARETELEAIKKEIAARTGLTPEVVTLYQGGETWIYSYKKHTDVRLVMAPEEQIAFFGGDPDNFTYPRHNLDFSIFRVYENGKPYNPPHHLAWTRTGLQAGDMTFVTGHPGSTARLETTAQMKLARDVSFPLRLKSVERQIKFLKAWGAQDPEKARQVGSQIFGLENTQKAITGYRGGLLNADAMKRIEQAEQELQAKVKKDPKLQAQAGQSWAKIAAAMTTARGLAKESAYVNTRGSQLLGGALNLVRLADEEPKADDKRLTEFKETNLKRLKAQLGNAPRNFNKDLEIATFAHGLQEALDELGANHPFVKAMLGGKQPMDVAKEAVEGSRLADPAVRKALLEGGKKAVAESKDPMILLAKKLDPLGRDLRRKQEDINAVVTEHGGRIAKARFAVYGKETYPDATFSLRLSYGAVESYPANGTRIQPFTTFAGLYDRAWGWGPAAEHGAWALPQRWLDRKGALDLSTPFNYVHTMDIIGGNSGSPVVDKKGELVGLVFDGNIESLPGRYYYDERVNRAVSVDARAIAEAMAKVYDAGHLVDEIHGK